MSEQQKPKIEYRTKEIELYQIIEKFLAIIPDKVELSISPDTSINELKETLKKITSDYEQEE